MAPVWDITPERRGSMLHFFYRQLFVTPPPISHRDVDLSGKIAIITGANGGLGLEIARQLLNLACKVILAVRDETKGESARQELAKSARFTSMIEVWKLDLLSYSSIISFANRAKELQHLDVVILNAGVYKTDEVFSPTGYEQTIQVNYLSTILLATLLLPLIANKKTGPESGRLVVVSSDTAAWACFDEQESNPLLPVFKTARPNTIGAERYGTSKLLGQLFMAELAKNVPSSAVTISCANPGLCGDSDLARQFTGTAYYTHKAMCGLLGRTCEIGSRTVVHAVTTLGEDAHGQYVEDAKIQP